MRGLSLLCTAALVSASLALDTGRDYALMIDAGSTGSRARLYSWPSRVFKTLPPPLSVPIQQEDFLFKVKPGIDTTAGRQALTSLLQQCKADPVLAGSPERWADVPIFLFATAGMRVLDPAAREAAFAEVRATLAGSGFAFAPRQARVIAGEEEGVFGWLTANKLQGRLPKDPSQAYVGALDMGGASTQITFAPSSSLLANAYHVGLENQVQADVYTHSFLYFGLDKARWRTNQVVLLNTTQSAGGSWPHPCWLQNGSTPYQLTVNGVGDDVPFTGAGDWQACLNAVNYLMNKATVCLTDALDPATLQPATALPAGGAAGLPAGGRLPTINAAANSSCSVNGVYQPPLGQVQFYAFSGYSYLYEFFGLSAGSTPSDLARAGEHFCGLDLAAAQAEHPGQDEEFLTTYCFTAAYVYSLWTTGYGFAPDSTNIHVVTGADASAYSYAFGSMISEANAMAWSYDGGKPAPAKAGKWQLVGIAMICIASVATLAAFLLAFKVGLCCKREASPTTLKGDSFNIQGEQEASLVGRSSLDVHQGAAV